MTTTQAIIAWIGLFCWTMTAPRIYRYVIGYLRRLTRRLQSRRRRES
jgi:hypothetical protein